MAYAEAYFFITTLDTTFANKALNAFTDTINASAGYAENWNDFATNLAVNGFTNSFGLGIGYTQLGRGIGVTGKKFIKQGFNFLTDKAKNMFYDDNEDSY